jgi:hypothetical protein
MTRLTRSSLLRATLVVALGVCGSGLQAQTPPKDPVALYAKGKAAIEKGDFQTALANLQPSYEALPSPNTLLLVAHARLGLGKKLEAVRDYEKCAADAAQKVEAGEQRFSATLQEARKWVEQLAAELAKVTVEVSRAPEQVQVFINGEAVKLERAGDKLVSQATWVMPGQLEVRVDAQGGGKNVSQGVVAGTKPVIAIELAPAAAVPEPTQSAPTQPPSSRPVPMGVWVAGGLGVAGLATFGIFGMMARSDYDALQSCSPRCPETERSTADAGKTKQTVANVGLVVGGLGLATAAGLFLLRPSKQTEAASVGLVVAPGAVGLRGSF